MSPTEQRASYHHGALREELLNASLELIRAEGIGAVSIRRVAREAGVSPGAPYHHFADRAALLGALSVRGFELLGDRLRQARAGVDGPIEALGALIETYVLFASEQPAYFQLMFRPELSHPDKHPDVQTAGDDAFQVLAEVVDDCQRAGVAPAGNPAPLIAMAWALGHGLAALWLDGPLEDRSARLGTTPEALTLSVARTLEMALVSAARAGVQVE
jgi:AcrR family transcriptional regulator